MARSELPRRVIVLRVVFAALALLCVAGWLLARSADASTLRDARAAAENRTAAFASSVERLVETRDGRLAVSTAAFEEAAQRAAAADATFARARLWDADGALVASSDPKDRAGKVPADQGVRSALRGETAVTDVETSWVPPAGGDTVTGAVTQVAVPLQLGSARTVGAVEVDFVGAAIGPSRWQILSIALVAAALVFAIGFVWAMTRKVPEAPVVHRKVEAPRAAPVIGHDFAARRKPSPAWVAAPSDAPPPPTSVAELEAATSRIAQLEQQLRRAAEESERVAALEEQVAADAPEIEALRAKLAAAEAHAANVETLLLTAQDALAAAHAQVGDTRVEEEAPTHAGDERPTGVADPVEEPPARAQAQAQEQGAWADTAGPPPIDTAATSLFEAAAAPLFEADPPHERAPEPEDPTDLIAVLEARVAEAEARAQQAKEEALQLSPEASDLRVRLARTAARKKMGSSTG